MKSKRKIFQFKWDSTYLHLDIVFPNPRRIAEQFRFRGDERLSSVDGKHLACDLES